jgi:plastocyanin
MRLMWTRSAAACAVLALVGVLCANGAATAAGWGTVKGQVIFNGKVPANPEVTITADKDHCSSKGPIHRNELVINKKNKGVRWVLVWLAPVKNFRDVSQVPPIHPSLKQVPAKVTIDQPVCRFIPRMTAMREGTTLVYTNTAPVSHNVSIQGGELGPNLNQLLIPKKGELVCKDVKARLMPFSYNCSIHAWMKGWVAVFKHPYYAVTDENGNFEIKNAPAGKWRLMLWQEKVGWVIFKNKDNIGKIITVKDKGTTTEKIQLKDED